MLNLGQKLLGLAAQKFVNDFLHRNNYNRTRYKYIEQLDYRYHIFYDRRLNHYCFYKIFDAEANKVLMKEFPYIMDHSDFLSLMFTAPYYNSKDWVRSKLRSMDGTVGGVQSIFDMFDRFLRDLDEYEDGGENLKKAREIQNELDKDFEAYMIRGRISSSGSLNGRHRISKNQISKTKKTVFVGSKTGQTLGVWDPKKKKMNVLPRKT